MNNLFFRYDLAEIIHYYEDLYGEGCWQAVKAQEAIDELPPEPVDPLAKIALANFTNLLVKELNKQRLQVLFKSGKSPVVR